MTEKPLGIVVGVTAAGDNTSALRWAAAEAGIRHRPVTLVHTVTSTLPPPPPSVLLEPESLTAVGGSLLRGVVAEYRSISGGLEPDSELRHGHPSRVLTELSERADLVVLAHRHLPMVRRIVTFSTSASVAAHAHCPVVAVPHDWPRSEDEQAGERDWVTVGVHERGTPTSVLEAAFNVASSHGLRLRLVHAWRTEPQYDDIIVNRISADWVSRTEKEILAAAEPVAVKYPEVVVEAMVQRMWPGDALADFESTSALLVLGRHGGHMPLLQHIGSIARTALRTIACPVMIVPV